MTKDYHQEVKEIYTSIDSSLEPELSQPNKSEKSSVVNYTPSSN